MLANPRLVSNSIIVNGREQHPIFIAGVTPSQLGSVFITGQSLVGAPSGFRNLDNSSPETP